MAENIFAPQTEAHAGPQFEPELRHTTNEPKGVLQKNLKTFVYRVGRNPHWLDFHHLKRNRTRGVTPVAQPLDRSFGDAAFDCSAAKPDARLVCAR